MTGFCAKICPHLMLVAGKRAARRSFHSGESVETRQTRQTQRTVKRLRAARRIQLTRQPNELIHEAA